MEIVIKTYLTNNWYNQCKNNQINNQIINIRIINAHYVWALWYRVGFS